MGFYSDQPPKGIRVIRMTQRRELRGQVCARCKHPRSAHRCLGRCRLCKSDKPCKRFVRQRS